MPQLSFGNTKVSRLLLSRLFRKKDSREHALTTYLTKLLGYTPKNLEMYRTALRHKSAAVKQSNGIKNSNERLEFLGDAVLDSIVAEYLYQQFLDRDEGFLTKTRAKLVGRDYLNRLAVEIGLDAHIESNLEAGDRSAAINGNALEAVIGAAYLDLGYNHTKRFVIQRLIGNPQKLERLAEREVDYKSKLIEWTQKEKRKIRFEVRDSGNKTGDGKYVANVLVDGKTMGTGQASSKKKSEQRAAGQAWEKINNG